MPCSRKHAQKPDLDVCPFERDAQRGEVYELIFKRAKSQDFSSIQISYVVTS